MVNIVIFSKNRACQLELLLRSIKEKFVKWNENRISILYKSTTEEFDAGYSLLMKLHPEFNFIREHNFKNDLIQLVTRADEYTMFLVDDNVFIRRFGLEETPIKTFMYHEDILTVSLRMAPYISKCYTQKRDVKIPKLHNFLWNWIDAANNDLFHGYPSDWGYPMSVDGHLFRTFDIISTIENAPYKAPNTFESYLAANSPRNRKSMLCFEKAKILNIPANKVQEENGNHAGVTCLLTAEEINSKFLKGAIIDTNGIYDLMTPSPHFEMNLNFTSR
jgi:hypothetical protein